MRFKTRLMTQDFSQVHEIDYQKTFVSTMRRESLRVFLVLVAMYDLELHQMNVKTIYLRDDLKDERKKIYIRILSKIDVRDSKKKKANIVCRIKKSLYDFKQFERF